jgi:hypothetical protein
MLLAGGQVLRCVAAALCSSCVDASYEDVVVSGNQALVEIGAAVWGCLLGRRVSSWVTWIHGLTVLLCEPEFWPGCCCWA